MKTTIYKIDCSKDVLHAGDNPETYGSVRIGGLWFYEGDDELYHIEKNNKSFQWITTKEKTEKERETLYKRNMERAKSYLEV